jgi:hypothetical protein
MGAALAAFIGSAIYYSVFTDPSEAGNGTRPTARPWVYGAEFARTIVVAAVLAGVASIGGVESWPGGLLLGLALWLGFPLMLWVGAILHEGTSFSVAAVHAGDWLFKLVIIGAIVGVWG